ncbi:MAG: tRNA preQ1(34) S-adenosylmethionine ribosyltransferase-isomerase QueA [Anaerolineaceae bacterium]|nr:tRNA preQ1(34) S-adenosylmethionine ribosyltransferase-isomerase QueA [Anaerolineaceae bacterium]
MKTSDFDYHLPLEYIAQTPIEPRHASRLLVLNRSQRKLEHSIFWNLGSYLQPGDLLVINQTRVLPARLFAKKTTGGRVEILLLRQIDELTWEALGGGKGLRAGRHLQVENGPGVEIIEVLEGPKRLVRFAEPIEAFLDSAGEMPLPPYIHTKLEDPERYQTVYASTPGSAAAPTAGLHFTPELMARLGEIGIRFAHVTLHVGLDTFAPVTEENVKDHKIHTEWCEVPEQTVQAVNSTREAGKRVIAVGTTSVRTIESAARSASGSDVVTRFSGFTDLFITPGYEFKVVDAMITNFHLPRSTLLMLVSAFAGHELILETYQRAVESGYRFYSFGDAMLIV